MNIRHTLYEHKLYQQLSGKVVKDLTKPPTDLLQTRCQQWTDSGLPQLGSASCGWKCKGHICFKDQMLLCKDLLVVHPS